MMMANYVKSLKRERKRLKSAAPRLAARMDDDGDVSDDTSRHLREASARRGKVDSQIAYLLRHDPRTIDSLDLD